MEPLWQEPSEKAREVIRHVAEQMLPVSDELTDKLWRASQAGTRQREYIDDPVLAEADRRLVRANMTHWLVSNIDKPGARVPPNRDTEMLIFARDLVLRGLDTEESGSWRAAQRVGWAAWLDACFVAPAPPEVLREVMDVSANSFTAFIDDSMTSLNDFIEEVRAELGLGVQAQRQTTVQLLLQGARISRARAEEQLGYALTGPHVGAVIWTDAVTDVHELERAAETTMRACGAGRRLTIVPSTAALWIWIPSRTLPAAAVLADALKSTPGARVALGRPADDLAGFRQTHSDAMAAQRLVARVASPHRVVRYGDVELVDLLTSDLAQAEQFVASTLGDLASADPVLQHTVRVFVNEGFSISVTAERIFAHRNTVDRRLARARKMLPRPLESNPTSVAAALMLVELRQDMAPPA